jgi:hypothetical protein
MNSQTSWSWRTLEISNPSSWRTWIRRYKLMKEHRHARGFLLFFYPSLSLLVLILRLDLNLTRGVLVFFLIARFWILRKASKLGLLLWIWLIWWWLEWMRFRCLRGVCPFFYSPVGCAEALGSGFNQGCRYKLGFGREPPCEVGEARRWAQADQPHLSAICRRLCSRVFSCPLEASRQFLRYSDVIWFGSLSLSVRTLLF